MVHPSSSPIRAQALHASEHAADGFAIFHERYRGFAAAPHSHDYRQVLVPLAGRMHLMVEGQDFLIAPEWAAVLRPGVQHAFSFIDGEMAFLAINVPVDGWPEVLADGPGRSSVFRDARVWLLGRLLAAECDAPVVGAIEALAAGLQQLGIYLQRAIQAAPAPALAAEPRILRAVDRILRDYADDLTVASLAEEFAMSQRHFERRFREALGVSPRQFLIDVRLSAAKELLTTTRRPVAAVAFDVGFCNVSHFSDTFHGRVGLSPRAFRLATPG